MKLKVVVFALGTLAGAIMTGCGVTQVFGPPENPLVELYDLRAKVKAEYARRESELDNARLALLELRSASDRLGIAQDVVVSTVRRMESRRSEVKGEPRGTAELDTAKADAAKAALHPLAELEDAARRLVAFRFTLSEFSGKGLGNQPAIWKRQLAATQVKVVEEIREDEEVDMSRAREAVDAIAKDIDSEIDHLQSQSADLQRASANLVKEMNDEYFGTELAVATPAKSPRPSDK